VSAVRTTGLGSTRSCPHCKATVLASASICPACQHHLRFNAVAAAAAPSGYAALQVEGTVRHKQLDEPCEFCVVLAVANERGEQITRQVVAVGVLQPAEARRFSVSVNLVPARTSGLKAPGGT
jgi:hypothetical protein